MKSFLFNRRVRFSGSAWIIMGLLLLDGCSPLELRSQSPEQLQEENESDIDIQRVGDLSRPWGVNYQRIEGIALITNLSGTGSDPPPTPQRSVLINDMQSRSVKNPNTILSSQNTSLVLVRGFLPPGTRKGDRFDVEVMIPTRSDTQSLEGGWLMQNRLRQLAVLNHRVRSGHVTALAEGAILTDSMIDGSDDSVLKTRGRILGGGVAKVARPLRLVVNKKNRSVRISSLIGSAINRRFHTFSEGVKISVAKPKKDDHLELEVHPKYKYNLPRYVRVVLSIPVQLKSADRVKYLNLLEKQLAVANTAATAAVRLEALGKREATTILAKGIESENIEIRFYAAEALAYLDDLRAAKPLAQIAEFESAFRSRALIALGTMNSLEAQEQLKGLLDANSAEARYGAFSELKKYKKSSHFVRGENLGGQFIFHQVPTEGEAMIHVARSRQPEVVLFGKDLQLKTPLVLFAGKEITIKSLDNGRLKVSRFSSNMPDTSEECSTKLAEVIRTVVKLGGTYPDIVSVLRQAKTKKYIDARFAVEALPRSGRKFFRRENQEHVPEESEENSPATSLVPEELSTTEEGTNNNKNVF